MVVEDSYIHPLFPKILTVLSQLSGQFVILCHQHADPDALGSAIALKELVFSLNPSAKVFVVMKSANVLTKKLAESINVEMTYNLPSSDSHLFLVDTNNLEQTGFSEALLEFNGFRLAIDHHSHHHSLESFCDLYLQDSSCHSCSELIFWLLRFCKVQISPICASALLAGIVFDTQRFLRTSSYTFDVVKQLDQMGGDYSKVISTLSIRPSFSERVARLKAFSRILTDKFESYIVAVTYVSAFEAAAARSLINVGADLVLVFAARQNETRVSLRASYGILHAFSIHLGNDFCPTLAELIDGVGGGHPGAAGINGKPVDDVEKLQKQFMEQLLFLLRKKLG
ncbi:MAG: bifunctional oligoribonuclease/PAP phosphatase NrnA [Candidatus Hermodarchaeota archaeon]